MKIKILGVIVVVAVGGFYVFGNEPDQDASLQLVDTITVAPDDVYDYGAFCRINYVETTDSFVVTFGGANRDNVDLYELAEDSGNAGGFEGAGGYAYKIYSTDLEYFGEHDEYIFGGGDAATVMVNDIYYHLTGGPDGWRLGVYDAATWEELELLEIELDDDEQANDQMISYVNGYFVLSSILSQVDQTQTDPEVGYATHNHVFDKDLQLVDEFVLDDVLHINGSSLVFVDGVYNFVTSTAYFGDLIVMRYDEDWNFLDSKILAENEQWPQGVSYDASSELFYVSYLDIGSKANRVSNVMLGVYDRDWNKVKTIAVTDFEREDFTNGGRPWLLLHDGKVYVSYDISTSDLVTRESNLDWNCIVSVFEM